MTLFKNAIVRFPSPTLIDGLTTVDLGKPDFDIAIEQHESYVDALLDCGLEVMELPPNNEFPDAVFVEDVAVCTKDFAILTNPGAPSRTGERDLIMGALRDQFQTVYTINNPGTLEGGDVLQIDNHFFVGISERTNQNGFQQFHAIVSVHGFECTAVPVTGLIHFKTGISYLGENVLLIDSLFENTDALKPFEKIVVTSDESYAANCILVNDKVFIPEGFPKTLQLLDAKGYDLIPLAMNEFQKIDGGLSCLSLRF